MVVLAKIADVQTVAAGAGQVDPEVVKALSVYLPSFTSSSGRAVTIEVLKTVIGPAAGEKISFEAFMAKPLPRALGGPQGGDVVAHGEYLATLNPARVRVGYHALQWCHDPSTTWRTALFCLTTVDRKEGNNLAIRRLRLCSMPVINVQEEELAFAADYLKEVAEWDNPRKLSPQEEAECATLVAALGDDNYATRTAAAKSLTSQGRCIRRLLEKAAVNPDPEVSSSAREILKAIRPPHLFDEPTSPRPE